MNRLLVFLILTIYSVAFSQESFFFIEFNQKGVNSGDLPLSEKSIERRRIQRINPDFSDYPVKKEFVRLVTSLTGSTPVIVSKWLNGVLIKIDSVRVSGIKTLPFVKSVVWVSHDKSYAGHTALQGLNTVQSLDYGNSALQIELIKANKMHDACLDGNGIFIAVFDGGFENADQLTSLSHIFTQNRLKFTYNIVDRTENVYLRHPHGTNVLSCLAAYAPGKLIGTGYGADFALFITEDVKSEKKIEEYFWLKGAEMADSIGADIISSSLGYYSFDDASENHTLAELDGKTAVITKAAVMASRKGILVVNSAGNNYSDSRWRNIVFPSDADSILSVGATDNTGTKASFSAIGPSADGRIKPEVSAYGTSVIVNSSGNFYSTASGTSYSAPLLAGLAAGLWQSNKSASNIQIRNVIIQSSSTYNNPNNEIGFGVPDFEKAYYILNKKSALNCGETTGLNNLNLYPNPVGDLLFIQPESILEGSDYFLADMNGKVIFNGITSVESYARLKLDLSILNPGIYILKIGNKLRKIVKI